MLSWAIVLIVGYALNLWVAKTFGPDQYGMYGFVMQILLWVEIVIINGLPYSVQKFVSSNRSKAFGILRTATRMQLIVSIGLFLIAFGTVPWIAKLFRDMRLNLYLRIAFIDILFYGFFHLLASFQNGLKNFDKQAILFVLYNVSKLGFVILFVTHTGALEGAFMANIAASILGAATGFIIMGKRERQPLYPVKPLIRFTGPSLSYFLMLNLFFSIDLWFVKYFLEDSVSGHYVAARLIAWIPYYLFLGLSGTVLPAVSADLQANNTEKARKIIKEAIRFLILAAAPICVLTTQHAESIITLLFRTEYLPGSQILKILIWGMASLSLFSLLTTVINAENRPKISLIITTFCVVLDSILNLITVPKYGAMGGAFSTTVSISLGVIVTLFYIYKRFHVGLAWISILRIGFAAISIWFVSRQIRMEGTEFIGMMLVQLLIYSGILIITREIRWKDITSLFRSAD